MRPTATLDAVNFSLAGAREGFGPFLGVYLQARGFDPALTGFIMSLAAASGLVLTTPIGTLIDRTERKRSMLVLAVAVMTVVARLLMVVAAICAPRIAAQRSYAGVMTVALAVTVVRGGLAFFATSWLLVLPVQMMEGLAMGLGSVAIPALSAEVMSGSGRASAGLGVVLTAFGVGATLSPLIAGSVAQRDGFAVTFLVLGAIAGVGVVLWTLPRILGSLGFAPATPEDAG